MNPTLTKLLASKANSHAILNCPEGLNDIFSELSHILKPAKGAKYEFVLLFAKSLEELEGLVADAKNIWVDDSLLWACYPKGTGTIRSDINRNSLIVLVEKFGLRPVTQVAIDNTWSAMRLRAFENVGK